MIPFKRWHYSVAFLALIIIPFIYFPPQDQFKLESSVWCLEGSRQAKLCKFKNICYDSQFKALLFFLSENSVIKGFDHYTELQKIELSSLQQHNRFYANLSVIDVKNFKHSKQFKIYQKVVILSRFKPNNIMHCIHDDLLPLYLTLESVCLGDIQCIESYDLVLHDSYLRGPFISLYELLSKHKPIILGDLTTNSNFLLCFKEMSTGLVQDSVVYQYGFKKPHGPIRSSQLTQMDISRFISFVKNKLNIVSDSSYTGEIILLSREKNRKILNVEEVKKMVKNVYKKFNKKIIVKLIDLNLFSNDFTALIKMISNADGLIGMHGAEMILSLFLKPNSFVFEIFPFGINPDIVSFIKPISELQGCNFIYFSWRNMLKNNSVFHPDAPSLFGGIFHLDENSQIIIKNAKEVPAVECCNNPLFLYHMYQDTLISNNFQRFFYESLSKIITQEVDSVEVEIINKWFHPYMVFNMSCAFQPHQNLLKISWKSPFNVQHNNFNKNNLMYSLHVKDTKGLFSKDISTDRTSLMIETPAGVLPEFQVWISAYFTSNGFKSSDLYINCK